MVSVMCPNCNYNYSIGKVDFDDGKTVKAKCSACDHIFQYTIVVETYVTRIQPKDEYIVILKGD